MVRTSIVLAVVAAALLGYILVFERGTISSREREQRKGNALGEFVRERVAKLEIQRKGATTVLVRDPEAPVEEDAALWRVEAPFRANADQDAVETLLGALEWLDGRRKLENITAEDRKRFGLQNPRYRVWFTVGKTRVPVQVGNPSPRGEGVYLSASDPTTAWVVGKELVEALDHAPGDYHTKELHDGVLVATTLGLSLRDAQGERAARKGDDGLWRFERGAAGLASAPAIGAIIDALDSLRARRFVAGSVKDAARYGLDRPRIELQLRTTTLEQPVPGSKQKPKRTESTLRVRVGAACEGHSGESYVAIDDASTVHCAADEDLNKLGKPLGELRETRLLPLEEGDVWDVHVARGDLQLSLTRSEERWSYELKRGGKTTSQGEARADAADDWLKALRAAQATRLDLPAGARTGGVLSARFGRGKDKPPFELRVLTAGPSEITVQRGDEPGALAFAAGALDLLTPQVAPFRALKLVDKPGSALQRLEVRRGAESETLVRTAGGLRVETPVQVPADNLGSSEIARLLGSLEAVRFVADAPAPAHGLQSPSLVAVAEFPAATTAVPDKTGAAARAPERVTVRFGAATEGGRFAELAGTPGVFVASTQLYELLSAPLADRNLLATPLEHLRSLTIQHGAHTARVQRAGERFEAAPGTRLGTRTPQALAETVATLRALRAVAYGPARPEHGLRQPFAKLEVSAEREGGGEQRIAIAIGAEAEGGRYARRDDQPITFVLPKAAIDALLGLPTT
jgi:hypothetical protein